MTDAERIQKLIDNSTVESVLKRGAKNNDDVGALQNILYDLGFGKALNWEKYGADGSYGGSSAAAVSAFSERNGLAGDGNSVTTEIAGMLLARLDILDDLRGIQNAISGNKVEKLLYRGSSQSAAVTALQTLLNAAGWGKELNWEKYGADGQYGSSTTNAVKAFAQQAGIAADGTNVTEKLAVELLNKVKIFFGEDWDKDTPPVQTPQIKTKTGDLNVRTVVENGKARIYVSDGDTEVRFTKFKKGIYYFGRQKTSDFIGSDKENLKDMGITDSSMNVMLSVSENEGNLDAVNTWDNSFMTFGMFQWTVGAGSDPGELAALLKKIKDGNPGVFNKFYGDNGLDVTNTGEVTGFITMNGKKLESPSDKEQLRANEWAFYFWKSGQDPIVKSIEVQHALSRLNTFYHSDSYKVNGYYISDLLSSEYGVGLILDNHVNRPGYVAPVLKESLQAAGLEDPANWETAEEEKLIEAYLKARITFGRNPMTDAEKRAAVTKKYLDTGVISGERGSFQRMTS